MMTDREILLSAIEKAEKNGYKEHVKMLPVMPVCRTSADLLMEKIFWSRRFEIIFSHEFAKAFWGEEEMFMDCYRDEDSVRKEWQYFIQQMTTEKDRFKYLEKFL